MSNYLAPYIGVGVVLVTPSADGTNGQVIQTDGLGNLSFADAGGASSPLVLTSGGVGEIPLTLKAAAGPHRRDAVARLEPRVAHRNEDLFAAAPHHKNDILRQLQLA